MFRLPAPVPQVAPIARIPVVVAPKPAPAINTTSSSYSGGNIASGIVGFSILSAMIIFLLFIVAAVAAKAAYTYARHFVRRRMG